MLEKILRITTYNSGASGENHKLLLRRRHHGECIESEGTLRQTRRADEETVENIDLELKIKV